MKWYLLAFTKYAQFTGRSRRTEYWMFFLFNLIFGIALSIIDGILGITLFSAGLTDYGFLYLIYSLAAFIPGIAVSVRRLHDIGKSGWMLLIVLIPIIGVIWLIVLFAQNGTPGPNEYGPDPKAIDDAPEMVAGI